MTPEYQNNASYDLPGPPFIERNPLDPGIKDQLGNSLQSAVLPYSYKILWKGRGTSPNAWQKISKQ